MGVLTHTHAYSPAPCSKHVMFYLCHTCTKGPAPDVRDLSWLYLHKKISLRTQSFVDVAEDLAYFPTE